MGRLFGHPKKNKEAIAIWFDCCLSNIEEEEDICDELWTWAQKIGALYQNKTGDYCVSFKSGSGVSYFWLWTTFVKWFLCTCSPEEIKISEDIFDEKKMFQRIVDLGF